MKFSVGTPPVETFAVADTGSDLTWIQCSPCTNCFHQKAPLFEPTLSSTYKPISCAPVACNNLLATAYCDDTCRYTIGYGDNSFSNGHLATETITLGSVSVPNVIVGCGHNDRGTFGVAASGIVGLGGGKTSLINQIGSLTKGKFSYCLGSYVAYPSKMSFGDDAVVAGDAVVTTAIVTKSPKTFYYLTLKGISVGNQRIDYYTPASSSKEREEGNIIIDSGTTLTFLPTEMYSEVIAAVKGQMKMREMEDPEGLLSLCYYSSGAAKFPEFVFHLKGADLKLKAGNIFVKTRRNCVCVGLAAASSEAIYGNLAQMDFLVGYDLETMTLSFKPQDCTKP